MKYRIIKRRVWVGDAYNYRYVPQVLARKWWWPWPMWVDISTNGKGWSQLDWAKTDCDNHSTINWKENYEPPNR